MIGRIEASDSELYDSIVIPDVTVGRRHAVIEYDEGAYWLQDQGSVNGSFVNGQRIEERHRLKDGDQIRIHKFSFRFEQEPVYDLNHFKTGAEVDPDTTLPQITFPETTLRPNDVLASQAVQSATILEIPRHKKEASTDHQRTQVLFRDEIHEEFTKLKTSHSNQSDEQIRKDIQDMTVQLFISPDDDKTVRLYSESLAGPPKERPDYNADEKADFSQMSLLPSDIDEKVAEALGDFFSDTQDEIRPHLQMTEKGDKLARMGSLSSSSLEPVMNEETGKS
jgi:pSer/pThr/pTyr-binding forkhead associated (FHA) protein